ncbi:hypothetical protein AAZV13_04G107050 [Glycine max]
MASKHRKKKTTLSFVQPLCSTTNCQHHGPLAHHYSPRIQLVIVYDCLLSISFFSKTKLYVQPLLHCSFPTLVLRGAYGIWLYGGSTRGFCSQGTFKYDREIIFHSVM